MRCPNCKTCLTAIKKGHTECVMTFDYRKCKNALTKPLSKAASCIQRSQRKHWIPNLNPPLSMTGIPLELIIPITGMTGIMKCIDPSFKKDPLVMECGKTTRAKRCECVY